MKSKEITEADFINLAADMVGKGLLKTGQSNFELAKQYAQQSQPSGMRWVSASERMPDIDTSDKWNNDNKITKDVVCWSKEWGRRFGRYYYNSGRWSIDGVLSSNQIVIEYWVDLTNPSESSPAGAAEGASEGMAEALRLLDTASNLVGNPGTNISSSTDLACDSWQEKYKKFLASISPGVEDGSGWVSLVDKLPDYGTIDVWVSEYHHKGRMPNVEYRKRDFHNKSDRFEAYMHTDSGMQWVDITNMVTHWRPLPAPPGE